jgi:hypothetical protein
VTFQRIMLTAAAMAAASAGSAVAEDNTAGLAEWAKVYAVFSHPRCANCHVPDDRPRWSGASYGVIRVHGFNVQRGPDGLGNPGLRCTTCHFSRNSRELHGPPGAADWRLPPVELAWWQKSSAQICEQIKIPTSNFDVGDKAKVAEHLLHTPLVGWGWAPGPGREPAPGSAEATYEAIEKWQAAGAPCPTG